MPNQEGPSPNPTPPPGSSISRERDAAGGGGRAFQPASAAPGDATTIQPPTPITEAAGTRIGPYRLLQRIGEGGFGVVFLAQQDAPVRRKVALKIIKLGMDTRQVIARFEAERQALALMDHPHIARVIDGGTTDPSSPGGGRPYFVMEYVVGDSVIAFADAHRLDITARLDLFSQVCQAVQHAHQKGIIHRDLKPGNILASMVDGKPFARVIDFGIAKATGAAGGSLTDKTLFTEHRQLMGTPEYMSPEQAEGSPDIDTRTDIYALGVLLYELLTGLTPFDGARLRSAAWGEMQRIIREEEPLAPSLRLSRSLPTVAAAAAARHTEPGALAGRVRGELDWIVLKAIDKDRARRYETANQFAADVQRHLAGEAVVAAPPSVGYRVRKFAKRHKVAVAVMGVLAGGIVATSLATAWAVNEKQRSLAAETVAKQSDAAAQAARDAAIVARDGEAKARAEASRQRDAAQFESTRANLGLARSAITNRELPQARDALLTAPEPLRNWEWRYLDRDAHRGLFAFKGHTRSVDDVAFSPNGGTLATSSDDHTARLWDVASGTPLRTLTGHTSYVNRLAYSPDGATLATCSSDDTARLWDVASGTLLRTFAEHTMSIYSMAFSPDGATLATGSYDHTARLWDVASGTPLRTLTGHTSDVYALAFSPDGATVATGSGDDTARLWDVASGTLRHTLAGHTSYVYGLAFSPDGATVATGSGDDTARLWDVASGVLRHTLTGHTQRVHGVAFSPDGCTLATASGDDTARLWDVATGKHLRTIQARGYPATPWFTGDGRTLLAIVNNNVKAWDVASGRVQPTLPSDLGPGRPPTVNRAGTRVAAIAGNDALLFELPRADDADSDRAVAFVGDVFSTSWSTDERVLVRSTPGASIAAFDTRNGTRLRTLAPLRNQAMLALNPDGSTMVVSTRTGETLSLALVPTAHEGEAIALPGHTGESAGTQFNKGGSRLATVDAAGRTLRIWDGHTGAPVGNPITSVEHHQLSPDGTLMLWWAAGGKRVHVVNLETGTLTATLDGHTDPIDKVVFSTDSSRVATTDLAGIAQVYDPRAGRQVAYFGGHAALPGLDDTRAIARIEFIGGNGDVVLSGNPTAAGEIVLWNGRTGTPIAEAVTAYDAYEENGWPSTSASLHRLATSTGGGVQLVDAETGHALRALGKFKHSNYVSDLPVFSPDGGLLVHVANQAERVIVDARTGDTICPLEGAEKMVFTSIWFTRNAHHLVSHSDKGLIVWDTRTGRQVATVAEWQAVQPLARDYERDDDDVAPAARRALPDVPLVVRRAGNEAVSAFDLATGKETRLNQAAWGKVDKISATRNGTRVLIETPTGAHLCDTATGREVAVLWVDPKPTPVKVVPHADGRRVALVGNTSGTVHIEPFVPSALPPDERRDTLIGHETGATALAFDAKGNCAATAALDGTIRLWDVKTTRATRVIRVSAAGAAGVSTAAGTPTALAFTPDGTKVIAGFGDGSVREFDLSSEGSPRELLAATPSKPGERGTAVSVLLFTPDGTRLAVWTGGPDPMGREAERGRADTDGTVPAPAPAAPPASAIDAAAAGWFRLLEMATGREILALRAWSPAIPHPVIDRAGTRLIVATEEGAAVVIDAASGSTLRTLIHPVIPGAAVYTSTGTRAPTGKVVSAAFDTLGQWIGTSGDDGRACVWRDGEGTGAAAPVFVLVGHAARSTSISFHPDGTRASTASADGTVRLWDMERGREMLLLRPQTRMLAVWFSPDGLWMVGRSETAAQIWNGTPMGWKSDEGAAP